MLHAKMISSKSALVSDNAIFYFRKKFDAPKGSKLTLNVFADARYKLYINGTFVAQGPCKAYTEFKYYDTLDVSSYLK